jgi:hypothetical protein
LKNVAKEKHTDLLSDFDFQLDSDLLVFRLQLVSVAADAICAKKGDTGS